MGGSRAYLLRLVLLPLFIAYFVAPFSNFNAFSDGIWPSLPLQDKLRGVGNSSTVVGAGSHDSTGLRLEVSFHALRSLHSPKNLQFLVLTDILLADG